MQYNVIILKPGEVQMVVLDSSFIIKEEIPTARFWLMTKLRLGMDRRWEVYLKELKERLISIMITPSITGKEADKAKKVMALHIMEKIENSAWRTMPSDFLKQIGVPRVLRR